VFRALVRDMSEQVRVAVAPSFAGERGTLASEERALAAFLAFVREHQQVYPIRRAFALITRPPPRGSPNAWPKAPPPGR
jgi:hypothetical protein